MDLLHTLLKRQVKKHCANNSEKFIYENENFLRAIEEAYSRFDADRLMIERSLELTSMELIERNKSLLSSIEKLNFVAYHDSLTGFHNRTYFIDKLDSLIKESKQNTEILFAVLFIDMDRFKLINDAFGHMEGDRLLVKIGKRISGLASEKITIARLGGDEFLIIVEKFQSELEVFELIEKIFSKMKPPFRIGFQDLLMTVSIGIAFSNLGYKLPTEILTDADTAMYQAKKKGRGRFQVFDKSLQSQAISLVEMQFNLRQAIEQSQFIVYYQPILKATDQCVSGFEALIRWNHPVKGFISPAEFIPIAEETGMINEIGQWVIESAAKMCKKINENGDELYISVNLSFAQFREKNIVEIINRIVHDINLSPKLLYIELTESCIMENVASGMEVLSDLRRIGVNLSLDDFGTGYSSLSYLKKFPIHNLKIDQTFIRDLEKTVQDRQIVKAIIAVAHSLDLSVTAEGVENATQLEYLKEFSCDRIQGFYFSKPLPPDKVFEFLESHKGLG